MGWLIAAALGLGTFFILNKSDDCDQAYEDLPESINGQPLRLAVKTAVQVSLANPHTANIPNLVALGNLLQNAGYTKAALCIQAVINDINKVTGKSPVLIMPIGTVTAGCYQTTVGACEFCRWDR